jgi:hypothetical protein
VIAICVCGSQAVALTLPAGPTGPAPIGVSPTASVPVAPTLPSAPVAPKLPSAPKVSTPKVSTPRVSTPTVSTPKLSTPKVSAPKITTPKVSTQTVLGQATPTGGGSGGSTAGLTDQASSTLRSPLRSVSRLASGSTGTSGGGLSGTLAGLTGGGGGAAGPGGGGGGGSDGAGGSGGAAGGFGAGGGAGGGPLAAAAVLLRAEAGLFAGALASTRGAGFEALQAAVAGLTGCVGEVGPLEQRLLVLRFGLDGGSPRSLGAVARALGVSRAGALQTERRALRSLRVASTTTGCAAAGSGIATIFDPTTIGLPAGALLGASASANGFATAGQLASVPGAAAPVWPRLSHGDIGWLLIALATLGALLALAGALMRGWVPPLPLPAASRALERIRRPAAGAGRQLGARSRGPQPLTPRLRYRRPDQRSE